MSQSAVIGGALLAGFVLFLAARNRLTVYERVLWGAKSAPAPAAKSGGSGGSDLAGTAADIAKAFLSDGLTLEFGL